MNRIEQYAKRPPLPCGACEDAQDCGSEMRLTCPSMQRLRAYRQEAYRRHLRWMVRQVTWEDERT